jgi:hypothetical protein
MDDEISHLKRDASITLCDNFAWWRATRVTRLGLIASTFCCTDPSVAYLPQMSIEPHRRDTRVVEPTKLFLDKLAYHHETFAGGLTRKKTTLKVAEYSPAHVRFAIRYS